MSRRCTIITATRIRTPGSSGSPSCWRYCCRNINTLYFSKYFNKSESYVYFYFSNINTEILKTSAIKFEYPKLSRMFVRLIISSISQDKDNGRLSLFCELQNENKATTCTRFCVQPEGRII